MAEEVKQNKRSNGKAYTADTFETLTGLRPVRERPGMFIGSLGIEGTYRLFIEAFGNVLDEFNAGRCEGVYVTINTPINQFIVEDHALGIPIEAFHDAVTKLHSGGKFAKSSYTFSIGEHAVGVKLINALSEKFTIDTWYGGKHAHFYSEKGIEKDFWIKDDPNHHSGTTVEWYPDISIFEDVTAPFEKYTNAMEMYSYINAEFDVNILFNGKQIRYYHPEGLKEYYSVLCKSHKYKLVYSEPVIFADKGISPIQKNGKPINMAYNVLFMWNESGGGHVESYVNGSRTISGGTHVTGFKSAVTKAIKQYIDKNGLLPKNSKLEIGGDDVHDCCVAIMSANHSNCVFSTQLKDALDNKDIQMFISTSVYAQFQKWLQDNSKIAEAICKVVIRSAKAKAAAAEAKANVIKSGGKLGFGSVNLKKYSGCKSRNPEECEIFIVEGDSAGGSAKQARNTNNQAVFCVRGKSQNVMLTKNPTLSEELTSLVEVLGCGIGPTFDINKLRFHKIFLAADADDDGAAIRMLLCGFFFKYFKPILEAGYLYEALPPLFKLTFPGNKIMFLPTQESFDTAIKYIATQAFDLQTIRGKKISQELTNLYLSKILDFKDFMEPYAVQTNTSAELLEFIVRFYDHIATGNFKDLERLGYECTVLSRDKDFIHLNIDKNYEHYFLVIDNKFYNSIYLPIAKKLSEVRLMDVQFKSKKDGNSLYGGTTYRNSQFIESLLLGRGTQVGRTKGLGESMPEELRYYMFNPNTRTIRKLQVPDWNQAEHVFNLALGSEASMRKQFLLSGKM